jgi:hypothetical protein
MAKEYEYGVPLLIDTISGQAKALPFVPTSAAAPPDFRDSDDIVIGKAKVGDPSGKGPIRIDAWNLTTGRRISVQESKPEDFKYDLFAATNRIVVETKRGISLYDATGSELAAARRQIYR